MGAFVWGGVWGVCAWCEMRYAGGVKFNHRWARFIRWHKNVEREVCYVVVRESRTAVYPHNRAVVDDRRFDSWRGRCVFVFVRSLFEGGVVCLLCSFAHFRLVPPAYSTQYIYILLCKANCCSYSSSSSSSSVMGITLAPRFVSHRVAAPHNMIFAVWPLPR